MSLDAYAQAVRQSFHLNCGPHFRSAVLSAGQLLKFGGQCCQGRVHAGRFAGGSARLLHRTGQLSRCQSVDDELTLIDSVGTGGIGQARASASSRDWVLLIVTWAMFDRDVCLLCQFRHPKIWTAGSSSWNRNIGLIPAAELSRKKQAIKQKTVTTTVPIPHTPTSLLLVNSSKTRDATIEVVAKATAAL